METIIKELESLVLDDVVLKCAKEILEYVLPEYLKKNSEDTVKLLSVEEGQVEIYFYGYHTDEDWKDTFNEVNVDIGKDYCVISTHIKEDISVKRYTDNDMDFNERKEAILSHVKRL